MYRSKIELHKGDCLIESDKIESGSVDLILTDLPYGTMNGSGKTFKKVFGNNYIWDLAIEPKKVYEIANRILRKNGKMILFSQEPYTTKLITEAIPNIPFGYRATWEKDNFANALGVNKSMVSFTEDVLVFSKSSEAIPPHDFKGEHSLRDYFKIIMDYIGLNIKQINTKLGHRRAEHTFYINSTQYGLCTEKTYLELVEVFRIDKVNGFKEFSELKEIDNQFKISKESERLDYLEKHNQKYPSTFNLWEGKKYKSNILKYKKDYTGHHPTQKPILLLEDLIKTFSNENDLVVDLTMGSGSTLVACVNTNRNGVGIEMNENYFKISEERIELARRQQKLF
jgi:site-specific DNA-methyltransferase (adenine-specific)